MHTGGTNDAEGRRRAYGYPGSVYPASIPPRSSSHRAAQTQAQPRRPPPPSYNPHAGPADPVTSSPSSAAPKLERFVHPSDPNASGKGLRRLVGKAFGVDASPPKHSRKGKGKPRMPSLRRKSEAERRYEEWESSESEDEWDGAHRHGQGAVASAPPAYDNTGVVFPTGLGLDMEFGRGGVEGDKLARHLGREKLRECGGRAELS